MVLDLLEIRGIASHGFQPLLSRAASQHSDKFDSQNNFAESIAHSDAAFIVSYETIVAHRVLYQNAWAAKSIAFLVSKKRPNIRSLFFWWSCCILAKILHTYK